MQSHDRSLTRTSVLRFIGVAAIAAAAVDGRQMHTGIDYHRYLAERTETKQELADWKANFGEMAKNNGWMPPSNSNSEERSADDEEEDHLQRFYMTKQNISAIQALNPNANFSTNTPFTLLTNDEFAAYVGKAYRAYNGSSVSSSSTSRRLRSWHRSSSTKMTYSSGTPGAVSKTTTTSTSSGSPGSAQTSVLGGTASGGTNYETTSVRTVTTTGADGKASTTTTTTTSSGPGTESTTVTTSSGSAAATASNFGFGSGFSSLWQQWGDGFNFGGMGRNDFKPETVKPAVSDSSSTITSAPITPTPTTAAPTTSAPTTAAPTTATPSVTSSTKSSASTSTVTATDTSATSGSNEVDWTDSNCVSPIQSQGSCGDCWAFSTASAIESGQCIKGGQKTLNKYSEQQLTSCDSQNYGCNGGAPVYAMEYVQQNGLCTEADYPYTSSDGTAASCATGCSAVDTGITGYETVNDASGLVTAVAQQPVIVAVASGNNAWKQYTGGVISSCDTSELDHAVVVVGYTDSEWKIRNSWGDTWGEEGYIRLERTSDSTGTCGMYGDMSYPTF